ncbi:MAG TPA: universal stress protein [Dehalococcoidales bacterium]|nr:universal stress protein [Dehalococcoidales bacterium]
MYKKILAPLDGSDYSECVLEHVKDLAVGCQVKDVVILYVIEPVNPGMYEVSAKMIEDADRKGEEFGQKYLAGISARLAAEGLNVETALLKGRVSDSILDYAVKNGVDLIAMTTHGRSGISRWILGSVADKIVRSSKIPVLLVSPTEKN